MHTCTPVSPLVHVVQTCWAGTKIVNHGHLHMCMYANRWFGETNPAESAPPVAVLSTRVANALGADNPYEAKRAAKVALLMSLTQACVCAGTPNVDMLDARCSVRSGESKSLWISLFRLFCGFFVDNIC